MARLNVFHHSLRAILVILLGGFLSMAHGADNSAGKAKTTAPLISVPAAKTVQKAQPTVMVPKLTAKPVNEAETLLKKAGLKIGEIHSLKKAAAAAAIVIRQNPAAGTKAVRGSAVDIWVQQKPLVPRSVSPVKSSPALSPRLTRQNQRLFLEFPQDVLDVEVYDHRQKVVQRFKQGRRFDVTDALKKISGSRLKVGYVPKSGRGVPKRAADPDPRLYAEMPYHLRMQSRAAYTYEDDSTIERNEPANNTINGATQVSAGHYSGTVGGDGDDADFLKATTSDRGFGSLVIVEVLSGRVRLHLYDPGKRYLDNHSDKVWIALRPNTTFYFQVEPTGFGDTPYTVAISKKTINDPYEANDTFTTAKTFTAARGFLGNVMNSAGRNAGGDDWYKIRLDTARKIRIEVGNAGLPSGDGVTVYLYEPGNSFHPLAHNETAGDPVNIKTPERGVLEVDLPSHYAPISASGVAFPPGDWRILITTHVHGPDLPPSYGTGQVPACFTRTSGYTLTVTDIP